MFVLNAIVSVECLKLGYSCNHAQKRGLGYSQEIPRCEVLTNQRGCIQISWEMTSPENRSLKFDWLVLIGGDHQ